jgi:hypothetical protein
MRLGLCEQCGADIFDGEVFALDAIHATCVECGHEGMVLSDA